MLSKLRPYKDCQGTRVTFTEEKSSTENVRTGTNFLLFYGFERDRNTGQ